MEKINHSFKKVWDNLPCPWKVLFAIVFIMLIAYLTGLLQNDMPLHTK